MRFKSREKKAQEKNLKYGVQGELFASTDDLLELLIDKGIESFMEDVEKEITEKCGERYKHIAERKFTRWGSKNNSLIMGGKKIKVKHPRIRNIQTNLESEMRSNGRISREGGKPKSINEVEWPNFQRGREAQIDKSRYWNISNRMTFLPKGKWSR